MIYYGWSDTAMAGYDLTMTQLWHHLKWPRLNHDLPTLIPGPQNTDVVEVDLLGSVFWSDAAMTPSWPGITYPDPTVNNKWPSHDSMMPLYYAPWPNGKQ